MPSLQKKDTFKGFIVTFLVKRGGDGVETYRVKDSGGRNRFLKLFPEGVSRGTVELDLAGQRLAHPNLPEVCETGLASIGRRRFNYVVYDFIVGESLANRLARERFETREEVVSIIKGVLNALSVLHCLEPPVVHNGLSADNVMLDMSSIDLTPRLVGLGCAYRLGDGERVGHPEQADARYFATEALDGAGDVRSDIYSVGVIFYQMLFGSMPVDVETEDVVRLKSERAKGVVLPEYRAIPVDAQTIAVLGKALSENPDERFQTSQEFIDALDGKVQLSSRRKEERRKGNGFADVAGMDDLKKQLQSDVIDLLRNPQKAQSLGLSIPNGLLFYGPPGCGKTFFAEKFAEELGCFYKYVRCSDVASPYIHGGQDKIAAIFQDARKNAPAILFLDELDAMLTSRSRHTNVSEAGEVNEFLTQLNNCGQERVLVIGATNRPTDIDEAALRAGRLELKYYIPQPDFETRRKLFEVNMRSRSYEFGIDYDLLAHKTENYVSADIKLIVDTAARAIFRTGADKITMQSLIDAIDVVKPSLTAEQISEHEKVRDAFTGQRKSKPRSRVGF